MQIYAWQEIKSMPVTYSFSLHAFMSINSTLIPVYRNVRAEKAMIYTGVQITHMVWKRAFENSVCNLDLLSLEYHFIDDLRSIHYTDYLSIKL